MDKAQRIAKIQDKLEVLAGKMNDLFTDLYEIDSEEYTKTYNEILEILGVY